MVTEGPGGPSRNRYIGPHKEELCQGTQQWPEGKGTWLACGPGREGRLVFPEDMVPGLEMRTEMRTEVVFAQRYMGRSEELP